MTSLEIRLLGGLQIGYGDAPAPHFVSSKAPALLAYLAVSGRPHQRDALAGLLWGEMPDAAAANNLRQALSNLRKLFEPYLLITRDTVAFDPAIPHFLDVEDFTDLLRLSEGQPASQQSGLLRQALALYRADFLEGFYVRDAPDFEDWALVQRVHLRERALHGWETLAQLQLDSGDYSDASEAAGRLLAMDPWREEAHRQRMLALARSGQHSVALAQYQACRKVLRQEFDAEPSAETTALFQRIRAAGQGPRHNLPAAATGFVGREHEVAELRRLLASPDTRLLTLLGPGGVGKTRLAVEASRACGAMFLNGVWFAPLAAVSAQPDALASVLAAALPMSPAGAAPLARQVLDFVRDRELLLVLDNLEHLLDETGWLGELLTQAPHVKLLVTSRERLDLQAERVFALDGLPAPPPSVADAEAFAAVQLFLRRTRRVQPDFQPQPAELAAIARICRAVQGLPLGIELAAAWADQLTCAEIAGQIEQGLDFLATTRRDVAPRQRSLRAVFDWSWGRLAADEQAVFQQLAVFQGSFTRQAAQDVAGASLPVLTALVDKSLVWRRAVTYQFHEVARHFAGEKLRLAGREEDTQARHARYYAELLARNKARLEGHEQKIVLEELDQEMENVRAAWQRLIAQQDVAGIAAATDGYYQFLAIRSRFREGLDAFDAARLAVQPLAATDHGARLTYAKATARAGRFLSFLSQFGEARTLLQESLAVFRDLGERDEMAFAFNHLGGTARLEGDLALAEQYLEECLDLRRATGNQAGQAVALLELAGVAFMRADYQSALDRCEEGLAVAERIGDMQTTAHLLTGLSLSHRELGQLQPALDYGRRSQAIYQELGDSYGQMQALLTLGELSRQMGHLPEARQFCQQAVQLSQEIGDRSGEADGHYRLGQIAAGLGERAEALEQLRLALDMGYEIQDLPITLDALLEIGGLLLGPDDARAAAILHFLLAHPQLPERNRPRAASGLAALSAGPAETGSTVRSLAEIVTLASAP